MNITLKNIDAVNAALTVAVTKEDYQPQVEKALNDIRKNIVMDGFRKGNAPKSRVQTLYGKSILVDEINKLVSEKLYGYIKENQLNVLGEPLPSLQEQAPLDFEKQEDYEFTFDLALAPEMNIKLSKADKLPYYSILVEDDMIEKQINNFKANYGTYDNAVEAVEAKDMVKGMLTGSNDDLTVEDAVLMPSYMKEETEKAKFIGAKIGDVITFNPYTAYEGHEAELASFLKIKKEEVSAHQGDFTFAISEITRYKEAELSQELYDKIYEPGTVTSEVDFRAKIKEIVVQQFAPESDYKFLLDAKQALEDKAKDIQFPDEFLKRWLVASDEKRTAELVEEDYPNILSDLKFQLIKDNLIKENDIKIEKEDVEQQAQKTARAQFAQYGMSNVPDYLLENYVQEMLKKEDNIQNMIDRVLEDKLIVVLKKQATLKPKEVTLEDFQKLFK
ncbi:MAG: Trigger factor [Candidatus Ordinivivax streblomastigis]|uniref:Trigger factor n=1 Tax=Candidatus Ordinivivax streblomastigis TaxID=2540710 RepID=A0A5M8NZZ1_9BACT|nr:MAG: Trigger factor [Candidatus Ordinivivax streblomastigis]